MGVLLKQLKKRRLELGLKQHDLLLRIGVSRQQYQHIESKGNPRLDLLELIAAGLDSKLMLIPKDKLTLVKELLEQDNQDNKHRSETKTKIEDDPWHNLLDDSE